MKNRRKGGGEREKERKSDGIVKKDIERTRNKGGCMQRIWKKKKWKKWRRMKKRQRKKILRGERVGMSKIV